jgi:glycine cleavage system H protein
MSEPRFTREHEWIRMETDGTATVGITDFAQGQLGDIVYVELPAVGKAVTKGGEAAVVESVKAASEVYAPIGGTIIAVNDQLSANPALVNAAPMGEGWFMRIKPHDAGEIAALMDRATYDKFVAESA